MGTYDVNSLLDMLKEKAKEKPEKYNIFICGPSYGNSNKKPNNKLRIYAYGGVLCELPTDRTGSNGKITPPAKKYSPQLENLNGLGGNEEREKFLEANLDGLMDAMEHRAACSAGERHTLFYSRRCGNGPSPHMSAKEVFAAIIRSVTAPGYVPVPSHGFAYSAVPATVEASGG